MKIETSSASLSIRVLTFAMFVFPFENKMNQKQKRNMKFFFLRHRFTHASYYDTGIVFLLSYFPQIYVLILHVGTTHTLVISTCRNADVLTLWGLYVPWYCTCSCVIAFVLFCTKSLAFLLVYFHLHSFIIQHKVHATNKHIHIVLCSNFHFFVAHKHT